MHHGLEEDLDILGELGLGGEVRTVSQPVRRLGEAGRLGFSGCILPSSSNLGGEDGSGMDLLKASSLGQAITLAFERESPGRPGGQ